MKLSREAIQRMISQKPRSSNVTVINQEGGGGVTLGPLLTSLNAVAMPTAEGYLHWTGSDWDFTSIDLSSYATEAWVLQQEYVTSSAISDMATETWVIQQGYITESAVSNAWKVKDVQVVDDNSVVVNGEDVIYGAVLASNGMLTLNRARLSIYVPEYTSDLVNDSGFIDQTGGTIESLTVTNDLDADSITVGSIVNSDTLAEYLDADAMQTWLQQQGYITQTTADGRYIKGVSVYGSSLNPDSNRVVNVPYADINTPGVIQIGTGLVNDNEGHTTVDTTVIASRQWANSQFVTVGNVQTITGEKTFSGNTTMVGNWLYFKRTTNGSVVGAMFATSVRPQGSQDYVDCLRIAGTVDFDNDGAPPMVNGNYLATQEWVDGRYLPLSAGGSKPLTGSLYWNVANQTDNLIISNNKIQLSVSGTPHNIMLFEGSTASLTSYAKFYERPMVKTGTDNGTPVYTNVALVSEVEAKQNIIHFFNTKNSNTEVSFSNIYLPLNYQGGGTVYLDLSDYATTSALSGYLPLIGGTLTGSLTMSNNTYLYFKDSGGTERNAIGINSANAFLIGYGTARAGYTTYIDGQTLIFRTRKTTETDSSEKMRITDAGNVGVGTTNPSAKLDVVGNIVSKHTSGEVLVLNSTASYTCAQFKVGGTAKWSVGADSGKFYFYSNNGGTIRMSILEGGNVGIGTTTPQAKLDVNGSVKIAGSLTGVTTISTSSGIFAGGDIETKGSFVWCDSQNFSLTIMEGLAVSGDANYCCALFRHKPQVQLGSDMLEVVVAKSDENGIEFRGSEDGTYTFGYGSGRGDIYAGAGDFTGAIEATSYNFRGTADAYGHGGASISHKSSSSVEGLEYYAGRSGQHYFKAYNSNGNEVYANIHCLTCDETSDIRQKEVVEYLNPSVYDIANAPIIKFRWIDGGNDLHLGSISQYWEKTLPETVHIGDDLMQSMEKSTIALLAGITAARKSVDNERRIAELELRVAELEDELAAMVSQQSETTEN